MKQPDGYQNKMDRPPARTRTFCLSDVVVTVGGVVLEPWPPAPAPDPNKEDQ